MRRAVFALLSLAAFSSPVSAEKIVSDVTVFESGLWTVTKTTIDDGTQYCVAAVLGENAWVNIWLQADGTTGIDFDSDDWGYDIKTETFIATIDNGASLGFSDPQFEGNSVYFKLPDTKTNQSFFADLRAGKELFLNNNDGELIARYPLSGSAAALNAAVDCMDAL